MFAAVLPLLVTFLPLALSAPTAAPPSLGLFGPISTPPSQDPFYRPDAGYNLDGAKKGALIKVRQIRPKDWRIDSTWQILYKTTSQNGTALAALATVFVPRWTYKDRFVLTARYENANSINCGPSTRYSNGTIEDSNFINKRWIVTSADYEGPDAANGAGRLNGHVLLDAGRATLAFTQLGLASNPKIVINGYSGGAAAASWAASLYKTYAPELNVVGSTFGGVPADMREIIKYIDGGLFTGLGLLGAFGLGNAYSAVDKRLNQILTPAGAELRGQTATKCGAAAYQALAGKSLLSKATNTLGEGLLTDSVIQPILEQLTLAGNLAETPEIPTFVYQGQVDQIIPAASVTTAVQRWCGTGRANLLFTKVYLSEHFYTAYESNVVQFIDDRFNGRSWPKGCRYMDQIIPTTGLILSGDWGRQPTQANSTIQKQVDEKQAQQKAEDDKNAQADPATQAKIIDDKTKQIDNAGN